MSATQTLAVEKILVRHNFTEEEVTEVLDYVENHKGDFATKQDMALVKQEIENLKQNISMLKWIMGLGFGALLTIMLYLHSDMKADISDMKADIKENQRLILQIIQKK